MGDHDGKVYDLGLLAANDHPHASGPFRCIACKHEWEAVAPMPLDGLSAVVECESCGCFTGQAKYPFDVGKDEEVWQCGTCTGHLFMITKTGTFCVGCGKRANF